MALTRSARVCALVPHFECGQWLPGAIESLLAQTRALDAVIVLDDASTDAPLAVAQRYPSVTFLRARENVGPYRMVQTAIERTDFDAYLFQDADDLSHPERLATLLEVAEAHGADIVGSHEVQLDVGGPEARPSKYAADVNAALVDEPIGFALLHPTSLVSRDAVMRSGGFPAGLRFGGDVDFLWRAVHCCRIVNADRHLYLRRRHPGSLTGSRTTGSRSPARRTLDSALRERARANARRITAGDAPDLSPFADAPRVAFEHLSGPELGSSDTAPSPRSPMGGTSTGPVLIVGGPRNGGDVLAWALDLHPSFEAASGVADRETTSRPVVAGPHVAAGALAIADRYVDTRIIHVVRDVETTVASLVARPDAHGDFYTERSAREAAVALGHTCDLLEAAVGPERALRVTLAQLIAEPAETLGTILGFLGAEPFPACALPFSGLTADARASRRHSAGTSTVDARRALGTQVRVPPLPARLRVLTATHVPDEAVVAVVSRGDDDLVDLPVGRGVHFPATTDGSYAGEYPPHGGAAVALLEAARGRGVTHLLVPAPSAWWLSHYEELRAHLDRRYRLVATSEGTGTLYELAGRTASSQPRRQPVAG